MGCPQKAIIPQLDELGLPKSKASHAGRLSRMCVSTRNLLLFGGCFGFSRVALSILAPEALNAAGGVHELLLTGKEGMTRGTNLYANVALVGGAGDKCVTAGAMYANLVVAGMDGCFHDGS